jgi:hypothetical protein
VIEGFCCPLAARAWGYETALAGARVCARGEMRAYLALHPHARLCFLLCLPGLKRRFDENEDVSCLP